MAAVRESSWFLSVLCCAVCLCSVEQSSWGQRLGPQLLVNHCIFWLVEFCWFNISLNLTSGFWVAAHSTVITRLDDKLPWFCSSRWGRDLREMVSTWEKFSSYLCSSEVCFWLNGQTLHSFSILLLSFAGETQEFYIEMLGKCCLLQEDLVHLFYSWERQKDELWGFEQAMAGKAWLHQLLTVNTG